MKVMDYVRMKGIESLYPHQIEVLGILFRTTRNFILSLSTGGGKTLIAEIMAIREVNRNKRKVIYIVPLKALANEKIEEFKQMFKLGIEVRVMTGDRPLTKKEAEDADVIITTIEKFDSTIRRNYSWLNDIGLVVIDEFHVVGEPGRGARIENIIRKAKEMGWRVIGLSATIPNIEEIASWMDAEYYYDDTRPVKVYMGIYCPKTIPFLEWLGDEPTSLNILPDKNWMSLVYEFAKYDKQILVFVPRRRDAENFAKKLKEYFKNTALNPRIEYYHGGLSGSVRRSLESKFRKREIDIMISTNALAMGVNFPADVVIIKGLSAVTDYGVDRISREMIWQMIGRAGRPGYADVGYAIIVASDERMKYVIKQEYFSEHESRIVSHFVTHPVFRSEVIGWIYEKEFLSPRELLKLGKTTLWYHQFKDIMLLEDRFMKVIDFLESAGLIMDVDGEYTVTELGEKIAKTYIDPYTAIEYLDLLKTGYTLGKVNFMSVYSIMAHSKELILPSVGKKEIELLEPKFEMVKENIVFSGSMNFDELMARYKLFNIMIDYYSGENPYVLSYKYNVGVSDIISWSDTLNWQIFALKELLPILPEYIADEWQPLVNKVEIQMKHRVPWHLVDLMSYGIPKSLAESLYAKGIKSLRNMTPERLKALGVPNKVIDKIFERNVKVLKVDDLVRRYG